jgi:hypothetical protein
MIASKESYKQKPKITGFTSYDEEIKYIVSKITELNKLA